MSRGAPARVRAHAERPKIFAILNVTPDSFSDGGRWEDADDAIDRALELREQGADFIDVGGESTRPGATRVDVVEEQRRVMPVVRGLVERGIPVSVDTMNSVTARAAAEAGAEFINDVSGGLADPDMYRVIAATGVRYIAMHWRGHASGMDDLATYSDVVREVREELKARVAELLVWGVDPQAVVLDPGLGFAKTGEHNWKLLAALPALESLGYPVLVGASRKRFLAEFAGGNAPTSDRDEATAIISALSAQSGAWGVRVHDVAGTARALDVWSAWNSGVRS
jgi:dihydropteroate synthase